MSEAASREFRQVMERWFQALVEGDRAWFEAHVADDYRELIFVEAPDGSRKVAELNKAELIDFDMLVIDPDIDIVDITAEINGDHAVSQILSRDRFTLPAQVEDPSLRRVVDDLGLGSVLGQRIEGGVSWYISAWRREGDTWVIFTHQLVGELAGDVGFGA